MVYCAKCGKKNEEGAQFCNSCGASLVGPPMDQRRIREDHWERECQGSGRECQGPSRFNRIFWGVILLLIGVWLLFEFGLKRISGMPSWVYTFEFWWIFPVIIGIVIIIAAIRVLTRKDQPR